MAETFEKPKGFKKKIENFWYHYKIPALLGLFFLGSALFLGIDVVKTKNPDMVVTYVSEKYGDESQFRRIEPEFYDILGDINGDGKTKVNYRLILMREKSFFNGGMDIEQSYNYSFLDKNVRLYFLEDAYFPARQAYFEPLEGILPEECLANGLKNEEGQVCAVPLAGTKAGKEMQMDRPEMYVAVKRIMDTEKRDSLVAVQHEKAKEIIKFMMEEDEA